MKHFEQREGLSDFIFLQMPNKMPAKIRWQFGNFCARLLNAAFTEQNLPRFNCLTDALSRMRFRNGDQFNVLRASS